MLKSNEQAILYSLEGKIDIAWKGHFYTDVSIRVLRTKSLDLSDEFLKNNLAGYDPNKDDKWVKFHFDELFFEEEVAAIKTYFRKRGNNIVATREITPLAKDFWSEYPLSAVPFGGHQDVYSLHEEDDYNLPFKIEFWFDIRTGTAVPEEENLYIN